MPFTKLRPRVGPVRPRRPRRRRATTVATVLVAVLSISAVAYGASKDGALRIALADLNYGDKSGEYSVTIVRE